MDYYLSVLRQYGKFQGRARRKEYWMFYLINTLITLAVAILLGLVDPYTASIGLLIYSLLVLLPSIAVSIRRMHDTDHSGWWLIVPVAGVVFLFFEGTKGDNRFGTDPKSVPVAR
ncbi:DUF805 domain-containing protein [Pseudomonas edaphica]|uniref:DUF805 domain-containing protein n=1 Tax=Pseudomonas edaphica TaxID=2006980 RepID=A0ABY2U496_9PSED|nr:DUF805 domain-containing protein [Pseudomonas edaphica]TLG90260.1 DUF805 domain-containing protein [Pseudomonas edaphica]